MRLYPDHAGYLEPGDEGVIVADVDLGYERTRPRHALRRRAADHPRGRRVAGLSQESSSRSLRRAARTAGTTAERRGSGQLRHGQLEAERALVLNAAALPGGQMRERRLRRLFNDLPNITDVEDVRRFTREVLVPPGVLPLADLRAALARGAADAIREWSIRLRIVGLDDVLKQLDSPPHPASARFGRLAQRRLKDAGRNRRATASRARRTAGRGTEGSAVRVLLPKGMHPATLGRVWQEDSIFSLLPTHGNSKQVEKARTAPAESTMTTIRTAVNWSSYCNTT